MTGVDVVVVGAGSAGAAVAARAATGSSRRVLLLEAGPDYRSRETPEAIAGPNYAHALALRRYRWPGLKARVTRRQPPRPYLQGRGVGGSSAVNGQGVLRGRPEDYDGWAARGCEGWAWQDVLPTFVRIEDDLDFEPCAYHGRGGPLPVVRSQPEEWGAVSRALRAAAADLGHAWRPDANAPGSTGLSPVPWSRRAGKRVSTNDAYLESARALDNLKIECDALVARVRFSGTRALGVEVVSASGPRFLEAGEVILCAGAIHSPAILMRSGVGPAAALRALGISVVADVPAVGLNLQDHPVAWLRLPLRRAARLPSLDTLPGHCVLRFAADAAAADDVEILAADRGLLDVDEGALMVGLMRPAARGKVALVAASPSVPPRVELRMLSAADDLRRLRAGVRHAARLARHGAFARTLDGSAVLAGAEPDASDDEVDRAVLASCGSYFHAAGTCAMGARDDPRAVTDSAGRVVGVERLRVVDASLIPALPCAPPYLTTVMLAEHLCRAWLGEGRPAYARSA